jgi:hypothetical protein
VSKVKSFQKRHKKYKEKERERHEYPPGVQSILKIPEKEGFL